MVTFNFSNATGSVSGSGGSFFTISTFPTPTAGGGTTSTFSIFTTYSTSGSNPIAFTSNLTGEGLPGDTMAFTITASSLGYSMQFRDGPDDVLLDSSIGSFGSAGTYTLAFDAGSGLNKLSSVSLGGTGTNASSFWLTSGGSVPITGAFAGEIEGVRFVVQGTYILNSITGTPTCFGRGTRIATPDGMVEVQDLRVGDQVLTADGETRAVLWVGRQSFDATKGLPLHLRPVRIRAGAMGGGLPERDLVVTGDHGLLIDGMLVNASALVNDDTIAFETTERLGRRFTVFHVETEDHTTILAEGCPAETFVDATSRKTFDNYDAYIAKYGAERVIPEASLPRITAARMLPDHLRRATDLQDEVA